MSDANRQVKLARRPAPGPLTRDVFSIEDGPIPEPGPGQFRVKIEYVSLDPAMRGWVNEGRSYVEPVPVGGVMRGYAAGHVEVSNHPDFKPGDAVQGLFGVQQYAVSDGKRVVKVDTSLAPLPRWIGGLGMPGWTAYFGLLEVGQPKPGETVVVSAASGAVGSIVAQIAKLTGCRAVGIAGGPEKCRYLIDELGLDAVDYKPETRRPESCVPTGDRRFTKTSVVRFRHRPATDEQVRRIPPAGSYRPTTPPRRRPGREISKRADAAAENSMSHCFRLGGPHRRSHPRPRQVVF